MIAEADENGDSELDRGEFDGFMEFMAKDMGTRLETLSEFLVYKILFNDGELDEHEDEHVSESDMDQINQLMASLGDPRMRTVGYTECTPCS